jgi:allene oxide cyclase
MHFTRTTLVLSIAPALALAFAPCGCADNAETETDPAPVTITVVEHADTDAVQDVGDAGDSVGDILTFANPLFDRDNKEQVGTDQGYCIRVKAGESWECMWTAFLADGQITVEGPFFDTKDSVLAITGGTEAYRGATGQMKLHFRNPAGTELDLIYEIE